MIENSRAIGWLIVCVLMLAGLIIGCGGSDTTDAIEPTTAPTVQQDLPKITSVELDRPEIPRYESIEFTLFIDAEYSNPYDAREIRLMESSLPQMVRR